MLFLYYIIGFNGVSSKRFDMVAYTAAMIGMMIFVFSKVKNIPRLIMLISRYSFGIYLLHQFYFRLFEQLNLITFSNSILYIGTLFISAITLSIITTYILNKIPFGEYIVGKVKISKEIKIDSEKRRAKVF